MWVIASLLWLLIPGFLLVKNWQQIGPPSAECADFAKQSPVRSRNRALTEHEMTCVEEAIGPDSQLLANFLKLAIFPPALLLAFGLMAIKIGNALNRFP
jgi:hypothetical protein